MVPGSVVERSAARLVAIAVALVSLACATHAGAAANGPAETSLDKCQNTLRGEGVKYVRAQHKAIATCLGAVSTQVVRRNAGVTTALATHACMPQFHKIGRTDGKSLGDVFASRVIAACEPKPGTHTLADLLGTGSPGVAEPLGVGTNLSLLCTHFGGDGSIDSVAEWVACMRAAQDCSVRNAIATEFPRAIEWLNEVLQSMPPSPAAQAAVQTEAAIDGASNDGFPDIQCASACGDGVRLPTELCDGADLAGATCQSLGFTSGTLACGSTCGYDVSGCVNQVAGCPDCELLATGQTTCWGGSYLEPTIIPCAGTGQDGETQIGTPQTFVDNGDGTISDLSTGLMWEKKSNDGSLHDKDLSYPWGARCGFSPYTCSRESDCPSGLTCDTADGQTAAPDGITIFQWLDQLNASSFAGYGDWRIPNRRELETLMNLGGTPPEFETSCPNGCTVTTCSCRPAGPTWTSTTDASNRRAAWRVDGLEVVSRHKMHRFDSVGIGVRAVRGGS